MGSHWHHEVLIYNWKLQWFYVSWRDFAVLQQMKSEALCVCFTTNCIGLHLLTNSEISSSRHKITAFFSCRWPLFDVTGYPYWTIHRAFISFLPLVEKASRNPILDRYHRWSKYAIVQFIHVMLHMTNTWNSYVKISCDALVSKIWLFLIPLEDQKLVISSYLVTILL